MIKTLYTNGCSWTAGNGIPEDPSFIKTDNRTDNSLQSRKYNWPNVLAGLLSLQVLNDAEGGGSNKRMVRRTCNYIMGLTKEQRKEIVVVLGWTTAERDEIYLDDGENKNWFHFNARQIFSETRDTPLDAGLVKDIDKYQKSYVTDVYTEWANMVYYVQQKFLMSNMLQSLGIKYIFFDALPPHFLDDTFGYAERLKLFQTPNMMDQSFADFCNVNNIPLSPCIHPMIDGHRLWADQVHKKIISVYGETL